MRARSRGSRHLEGDEGRGERGERWFWRLFLVSISSSRLLVFPSPITGGKRGEEPLPLFIFSSPLSSALFLSHPIPNQTLNATQADYSDQKYSHDRVLVSSIFFVVSMRKNYVREKVRCRCISHPNQLRDNIISQWSQLLSLKEEPWLSSQRKINLLLLCGDRARHPHIRESKVIASQS